LPDVLRDQTFASIIGNEESVQKWLNVLMVNLNLNSTAIAANTNDINLSANANAATTVLNSSNLNQQFSTIFPNTNVNAATNPNLTWDT
jgi:hypothetical protein